MGWFIFNNGGSSGTQLQVPTNVLSKYWAGHVTKKLWGGAVRGPMDMNLRS